MRRDLKQNLSLKSYNCRRTNGDSRVSTTGGLFVIWSIFQLLYSLFKSDTLKLKLLAIILETISLQEKLGLMS